MRKRIKSPFAWASKEQLAALRRMAVASQDWVTTRLEYPESFTPLDVPLISDPWGASWERPWEIKFSFEERTWLRLSRVNYDVYEKTFYANNEYKFQKDHPEAYQTKKLREELAELRKECENAKRKPV